MPPATTTPSETQMPAFNVRMNSTIAARIRTRYHTERPSRKRANRKPTYTRALPVSLSAIIISIGRATTAATFRKSLRLAKLKPTLPINVARTREVVIFEISAGWKETGPRRNHECEPFTLAPTKITATSRNNTTKYAGTAATSHSRGFTTKSITAASTVAVSIQTNCFPLRQPQSKMLAGSLE